MTLKIFQSYLLRCHIFSSCPASPGWGYFSTSTIWTNSSLCSCTIPRSRFGHGSRPSHRRSCPWTSPWSPHSSSHARFCFWRHCSSWGVSAALASLQAWPLSRFFFPFDFLSFLRLLERDRLFSFFSPR